jgi:hypothetical protein
MNASDLVSAIVSSKSSYTKRARRLYAGEASFVASAQYNNGYQAAHFEELHGMAHVGLPGCDCPVFAAGYADRVAGRSAVQF